jgi:tRNA 2-(methylsulfanyl)-N6-isopentenyladenosine37 hydroxylase
VSGHGATDGLGLAAATPVAWYESAVAALDLLLVDHANCEKKAASSALGLMFAYADDAELSLALARLAREELRHYEQVLAVMGRLGIRYARLAPGRYAGELRRAVATAEPARRLDLLITGALIEARSAERFRGLVPRLPAALATFYHGLEAAEARHTNLYLAHAERCAARAGLDLASRYRLLAALEAELATRPDATLRFHSGPPATAGAALSAAAPRA